MHVLSIVPIHASAQTVVRDVLEWIERFLGGLTVTDWVLVLLAFLGGWWIVGSVRSVVRLGAVEIDPLDSDEEDAPTKAYTAMLRERLARSGLSPPPEVPSGAPRTGLIAAVDASPMPQGPWLARLLEVLPTPPKPSSYRLSGTLKRVGEDCALSYWLRPRQQGEKRLYTAFGRTYDEAIQRAVTHVYLAITNTAYYVFPPWARWQDPHAFESYLRGLEQCDALSADDTGERALRSFERARRREPENLLPLIQIANLYERRAALQDRKSKKAQWRARALEQYLMVLDRDPLLVTARYRLSILLSMLARDWRYAPDDLRARLMEALGLQSAPTPDEVRTGAAAARNFRRKLYWRSVWQSFRAWLMLLGPWVLVCHQRFRHRFEPTGQERRKLKRTLALSRLCLYARAGSADPHPVWTFWHLYLLLQVSGRQLILGGRAAGWQAHYNAACCYALIYGKQEEGTISIWRHLAFKHLQRALAEPEAHELSHEWLEEGDPDLQSLRREGEDRELFDRHVARHRQRRPAAVAITDQAGTAVTSVSQWRRITPEGTRWRWEPERSAYELARSWLDGAGRQRLLETLHAVPDLTDMRIERTLVGVRSPLDRADTVAFHHDLVLIGDAAGGRTVVSITAKADERFGVTLRDHLTSRAGSLAKLSMADLDDLARALAGRGLAGSRGPGRALLDLRYQLFCGLGGVLTAAAAARADQAVLFLQVYDRRFAAKQRRQDAGDLYAVARTLFADKLVAADSWCAGPWHVQRNARCPRDVAVFVAGVRTPIAAVGRARQERTTDS